MSSSLTQIEQQKMNIEMSRAARRITPNTMNNCSSFTAESSWIRIYTVVLGLCVCVRVCVCVCERERERERERDGLLWAVLNTTAVFSWRKLPTI